VPEVRLISAKHLSTSASPPQKGAKAEKQNAAKEQRSWRSLIVMAYQSLFAPGGFRRWLARPKQGIIDRTSGNIDSLIAIYDGDDEKKN
jgi:hypothetical protein